MFVAYILLKSRFNKLKILAREKQRFNHRGLSYDVDPDAIYMKKFFGLKIFRYSQYLEGHRKPIIYNFENGKTENKNVNIDLIAQLMAKLRFMKLELVILIILIFVLIVEVVGFAQISGAFN